MERKTPPIVWSFCSSPRDSTPVEAYKLNAEFCLANNHQRHDDKIMDFDYSMNAKDGSPLLKIRQPDPRPGGNMTIESLPKLTKAPIPEQTHTLKLEERLAKGKALREVASRKAQREWKPPVNRADPVELLVEN